MNKKIGIVIVIIAIVAGALGYTKFNSSATGDGKGVLMAGEVAVIKLSSLPNGNYTNQKFEVKQGTKVRIEGDPSTLVGSMSKVVVDGYELSKDITEVDNVLEFVADKSGKYRIHCANGMGNAFLTVK
ncbi:MAG: hypothetical protein ACOY3M_04365 [Patescibacteria group bacterium]